MKVRHDQGTASTSIRRRASSSVRIAAELNLSEMTVKVHRGRVMRKVKAASLPELVRMADRLRAPNTTA